MDEQTNPMMPVPEVSASNPIPPPMPIMPAARPASSMRVVWIVLIGIVVLAGAAYGWMKLYPSSPVALESASPLPTASADATAGWKTYTNTQYGFEFKYPETTELTDSQFTYQIWDISATKIVGGNLRIDSVNPPFSLSVLENSLNPQNIYGTYGKIESPDLVQVGNQVGYKYREGDAGTNTIEIQTKLGAKKILLISFLDVETSEYQGPTIDPKVFAALWELQKQILSTFKFTK